MFGLFLSSVRKHIPKHRCRGLQLCSKSLTFCIHSPALNVQRGQCWEILSSAQINCRRKRVSLTTTPGVVKVLNAINRRLLPTNNSMSSLTRSQSQHFHSKWLSGALPSSAEVSAKNPLCCQLQNWWRIPLGLNTQAGPHLQTLYHMQQQPTAQLLVLARHTQTQWVTTTGFPDKQYFYRKEHI